VPLFALANAGITLSGAFLARAYTSPVTLGILIGYIAGKPLGITGGSWLLTRLSRGRLRPPVGWAAVAGTPTFFINGRRHYGSYDISALRAAVLAAKATSVPATGSRRRGDAHRDPGR
jgi:Na+/H+ antiporter 1